MQQTILNAAQGHPGIVRAKRQLRLTYWWPGMDSRVENHVKHCIASGPYQLHNLVRVRLPHIPKGSTPFLEQRRITAVLGHYTYRLNDGQVWNARKLVRVRQAPRAAEVGGEGRNRQVTINADAGRGVRADPFDQHAVCHPFDTDTLCYSLEKEMMMMYRTF